ncbi:MAG: chromosomal replication initiator protein DnaA [Chlamydiales bacterium]
MKEWEHFLEHLKDKLGVEVFDRWLKPIRILRYDARNLYLEVKDYFQALWFEEHVQPKAKVFFRNKNEKTIKVHLSIAHSPGNIDKKSRQKSKFYNSQFHKQPFQLEFGSPSPEMTFETFVTSKTNFIPQKLLSELLQSTKSSSGETQQLGSFNPIYLFGHSGTGKTHLLMAMANELKKANINVIYVNAETFTEHVINAIRAGEMSTFRTAYRSAQVLFVDDVHVFSRKGATQEEFFHTFNTLHLAGKQIILSARCAPQELKMIEPRLVSRFEWGIVLPLEQAGQEELIKILEKKMEVLNFHLVGKVKEYLIDTFGHSVVSLIKALEALILRHHMDERLSKLSSTTLNVATVKRLLEDIEVKEERKKITPEKVLQQVAQYFGVTLNDILGSSQNRENVFPRQIAMFLCRKELEMPFMKIGDLVGRDHSTVMASVRRIEKEQNEGVSNTLTALRELKHLLISLKND